MEFLKLKELHCKSNCKQNENYEAKIHLIDLEVLPSYRNLIFQEQGVDAQIGNNHPPMKTLTFCGGITGDAQ